MLEFPANPSINQIYQLNEDITFKWDGIKWNRVYSEMNISPDKANHAGKWLANDGANLIWDSLLK